MKGHLLGVIAQLVERVVRNDEVWSSILHGSTIPYLFRIPTVIITIVNNRTSALTPIPTTAGTLEVNEL